MGEIDLSPRQFAVLQAVADAEGLGQTAIMSARGLDRASTADLVRRLVAKGWLRRRRLKRDARLYAVRLTPEGGKVAAAGARAARAVDAALMHAVDQSQWAGVLNALWLIAGKTPIESSLRSRCSCVPKIYCGLRLNQTTMRVSSTPPLL